jgi:hypothetical protein
LISTTVLPEMSPEAPSNKIPRKRSSPASQTFDNPAAMMVRSITLALAPPFFTTAPGK